MLRLRDINLGALLILFMIVTVQAATSTSSSTSSTTSSSASTSTTSSTTSATTTSASTTDSVSEIVFDGYSNSAPNPITSHTPIALTPVTTLSIDSLLTITLGTTYTYTTTRAHTTIYYTTTSSGVVLTPTTTFGQKFTTGYSVIASPSSGSIGLGTLSGTVGLVESSYYLTISNVAAKLGDATSNPFTWFFFTMLMMFI